MLGPRLLKPCGKEIGGLSEREETLSGCDLDLGLDLDLGRRFWRLGGFLFGFGGCLGKFMETCSAIF